MEYQLKIEFDETIKNFSIEIDIDNGIVLPIDLVDETDFYYEFEDAFYEEINDALQIYKCESYGYFNDDILDILTRGVYGFAKEYLLNLCEKMIISLEPVINDADCLKKVIEDIRDEIKRLFCKILEGHEWTENACIDVGRYIIDSMRNFLLVGEWQYGFLKIDGSIVKDKALWPEPEVHNDKTIWIRDGEAYEPIIWFGETEKDMLQCWSISKQDYMFEGENSDIPWKEVWFNEDDALGWYYLADHAGVFCIGNHLYWTLYECGFDEPATEFEEVRNSCPILLGPEDSKEQLCTKIDKFFLDKIKERDVV